MLGCRSIDSPVDVNVNVNMKLLDQGELLENVRRYRKLVRKLNYLTVVKSNITFTFSVVSQFLLAPRTNHLEAIMRILRYMKKAPGLGLLYSDHGHIAGFSDADWTSALLIRGQAQNIVFSWRKHYVIKMQEAKCGLTVQRRIVVQSNDKCDIRATLNQKFIDRD